MAENHERPSLTAALPPRRLRGVLATLLRPGLDLLGRGRRSDPRQGHVVAENHLVPISDTNATDIFICGYPRSGNTWFQNLVAGVAFGVDPEFAHDSLIQDLVPDTDYKRYFKRYGSLSFFKSHFLPQPQFRRVVYLLRDGRDAMVSYYHFLSALQGQIDFLSLIHKQDLSPSRWHEHVEQWSANPFQADMIVIRYEDLLADTVKELQRFCAFAGLERDSAFLERIASKASFGRAKDKERRQGWDNPAWPRDKPFVRRGQSGSHRDEMPPEVQTAFLAQAGETLARFGYLRSA